MANDYRIVAAIDPQTEAGAQKVKQDLRGIQSEAKATETALNRSFDQRRFEQTIGSLITRLEKVDNTLGRVTGSSTQLGRTSQGLAQSLERASQAGLKVSGSADRIAASSKAAAMSQAQMDAALRRVMSAIDPLAAEQLRMNGLLADAKRLLDAGTISQERYAQVQRLAAEVGKASTGVSNMQRAGLQQLGFQIGDVATMYSLGARPAQIFASQIGQITQAAQMATGGTSKMAAFLGGPWGIAISTGIILLTPFVAKLLESNDALGDAVDKLRADAKETELAAKAKEAFARTVEGLTAAIREQNKELRESLRTQQDILVQTMTETRTRLAGIQARRDDAQQALRDAEDLYAIEQRRARSPGQANEGAAFRLEDARQRVEDAKRTYAALAASAQSAEENVRRADAAFAQNQAERSVDKIKSLNDEYDRQRNAIIELAIKQKQFNGPVLEKDLEQLEKRRKLALEAAQAQERLNGATAAGVATFRSREQAIGIAGREFQQRGMRVSENNQFGGVKGNHPGMGNAAHGLYAIDVDTEGTDATPTAPDIRAKYDAVARRYQSRGYKVLWAGWVYDPGGTGPSRRIPGGQDQHYGHMHLEAPGTIVGKPTQAGAEAQERSSGMQAERVAERSSDFVQSIVDRNASAGLPDNARSNTKSRIAETLAEFKRRFDREATATEAGQISKSFTDAEARAMAQRLDDAYVAPLERLRALQGKVGLEREILNRQMDEAARSGGALTEAQLKLIESSTRETDSLQREAEILQRVLGPMQDYRAEIEALNALLEKGSINQTQFNSRIDDLKNKAAGQLHGMKGVDPNTGRAYEDVAATGDENARYAAQIEELQKHREELIALGLNYDAIVEAAARQHAANLASIDQARRDQQINAAESIFGSLTQIAADTVGKQSGIYKALFAMEKAVAIARSVMAIQTGIAEAAAIPFPANLPAIASVIAATASIVSNIKSVSLAFADGGYVSGPGGARGDQINARLSNGEFVVNAAATSQNRALLEAINSGRSVPAAKAAAAHSTRPRITVNNYAGQPVSVVENLSSGDVEVIVGRVLDSRGPDIVRKHAPRAVAADLANRNGPVQKGLRVHTTADARKV